MENSLIRYKNELPIFFEEDYNIAVEKLTSHMKNKHYYLHDRKITYRDTRIEVDYATKNLNQSFFEKCKFVNCKFTRTSFVNSKFSNCEFINCDLVSANLRNSIMENCLFDKDNIFLNTKLGNCQFVNVRFIGCKLDAVALDEATFIDCLFSNNTWDAVSTNLCEFKNTTLDAVLFRNMNFEYSIFNNIHMNNMKIPFPTIPYIYGGLQYLTTTNDNVRITSQHNIKKGISKNDYLSQLDDLEVFYSYSYNYFPLANIYLAKNKLNHCKAAIIFGIENASLKLDLKMIENLARLISFNDIFSMNERYDIFNNTISHISSLNTPIGDNQINECIFKLRTYLFNSGNDSSLHMSIKTNIENEKKLSVLIGIIENIIAEENNKCSYNIEIRHNSPYELFVNLFSNYETVCYILGVLIFSFKGIDKVLKTTYEHIKAIQEIKKQSLENKILEQKIEATQIELKKSIKSSYSDEKNNSCIETLKRLNEQDIKIQSISYFVVSNNDISFIPPSDIYK